MFEKCYIQDKNDLENGFIHKFICGNTNLKEFLRE